MLLHVPIFVVAKALTQNRKCSLRESIYITLALLFYTFVIDIIPFTISISLGSHILFGVLNFCVLFIYFYKIQLYPGKKSFILMVITLLMTAAVNLIVLLITAAMSPDYVELIKNITLQAPLKLILQSVPFLLAFNFVAVLVAILFVKLSKKLRKKINQSDKAQTVLTIIAILVIAIMQISTTVMQNRREFIEFITSWELYLLFGFIVVVFVSFYFYLNAERRKMALQQKEAEQEAMKYYTEQIEQQQIVVQQFKHDNKNILLSIEGYLETNNIVGLKDYFYTKIKATADEVIQDNSNLHRLSKIKVPEIRATIMGKLVAAQSVGINTTLEVVEEINNIFVDSISLVRILGIVLDNAIEALNELQIGTLSVACFKQGQATVIIVQNTCKEDLPPLSQLRQTGFSTKGTGRGLGLSNLAKLVGEHANIVLQTNVSEGMFTQKITIFC